METTAPQPVDKPKRSMTQEQLDKLAHARELALRKRREMAAARAVDREALVLEKISAKKARDNKRAEIEAERRAALDTTPPTPPPTVDAPKPSTASIATTKPKKRAVVVETSDSSDSEGFIDNARVFIVKRERSKMVNVESAQPGASTATTAPPTPPDPHEDLYARMFGR